jgi:dolichol-phosphate mannosyltransferase
MITVMVPALNEEKNIVPTVNNLLRAAKDAGNIEIEIIVVNDGSTDKTGTLLDELTQFHKNLRVIHNKTNMGIGSGFRAALEIAKHPKYMIVPGDNDMPLELMVRMLAKHDTADVILGYWLNKEDRGKRRNVLSTVYNTIYMVTFDIFIQYLNGPTIYPTEVLRKLHLQSERFSVTAEATIKVLRHGCSFCELPGYMQTGLDGSTSFGLKNLVETMTTYINLVFEIYISRKSLFSKRPKRIRVN